MWKASEIRWPCLTLLAIVIAIGLRPGDSGWFFDMSRDFDVALQFSAPSHPLGIPLPFTPAPYALKGTHGIRYGPLPVWIDQVFLTFTHNLILMSAIREIAVSALIAVGLLWLTQLLRVTPWLAVVVMLSPWMWYYSRQLWDNSLSLPFAVLLFAAYGQFLETKRAWALCLAIVCAALSCLIHLIVVPFLAALALHALIFETKWVMKSKWLALATMIAMFAISEPYLHYVLTFHGSHVPNYAPWWRGWVFPLLGAQHLTAKNVGWILEESWDNINPASIRYAFKFARLITCIGYIACWTGMIIAIPRARRAIARQSEAGTVDQLCLIALAAFIFQIIFDGPQHVSLYPHYHSTTWIIYVMFAWLAFDALPRWFGARSLVSRLTLPVYAASLFFVEIIITWQIARNGGTMGNHYNAVLSNQIDVVKELGRFSSASPINVQVYYWQDRPDTLRVLRELISPPTTSGLVRKLVVRFRYAFPGDARIVVDNYPIESAGGATQP
jgi:hypothetical protein